MLSMESGCVDNRHSPPRLLLSITSEASMASNMKVNDKARADGVPGSVKFQPSLITCHADLAPLLPRQFKHVGRNAGFGWGAAEGAYRLGRSLRASADRSLPLADAAMTPPPTSPGESVGQEIRRLASQSSIKVQDFARRSGDDGFLQPPKSPRATASGNERAPLLGRNGHGQIDASHFSTDSTVILADYMAKPSLPLPLVIAHELAMFFATAKKRGALESLGPAGYNAFQASVNTCIDQFTVLERLGSIDIPTVCKP